MTSSYESYSRAGADEPDVGIPNILKRILRISLPARAVNRGPALFGANHGQLFPNPAKEGLPTIRPECELGLGCMYSSPSARFSALHTFQAFGNSEKPPRNNGLRGALAVE